MKLRIAKKILKRYVGGERRWNNETLRKAGRRLIRAGWRPKTRKFRWKETTVYYTLQGAKYYGYKS